MQEKIENILKKYSKTFDRFLEAARRFPLPLNSRLKAHRRPSCHSIFFPVKKH